MSFPCLNQLNVVRSILYLPIFSTCFAVLILLVIAFFFRANGIPIFSPTVSKTIKPSLLPCTLPPSAASTVSSDGLVAVAVRTRPLVRTLCAVLQPIGEVGIAVCAVNVRLVVVVGGGAYISVTSSVPVTSPVSGLFSSLCAGSSPSVD